MKSILWSALLLPAMTLMAQENTPEKVPIMLPGKGNAAPKPFLETWKVNSPIARSSTGDVTFTPSKVTFQNGAALFLTFVREELDFGESERDVHARIYRVKNPSDPKLLNGNRLCGFGSHEFPVRYIAVWAPVSGSAHPENDRMMGIYTDDKPPQTIHQGSRLCHDYRYTLEN